MLERFNKISKIIYIIFYVYVAIALVIAIPINILKPDNIKPVILNELIKLFFAGFLLVLLLACITMFIHYILWISQIKKVGIVGKIGIGTGIIILLGLLFYFDILIFVLLIINIIILGIFIYLAFKIKKYKPETYAIVVYFDEDTTLK